MTTPTIGVLGYGRFGRALASLFQDAGLRTTAHDPEVSAPPGQRAESVERLLAEAGTVFLAVPVHAIPDALAGLRPHLRADHLVVDVASVKQGPVAALTEVLGRERPWIATHPLFGPSSVARGERPLDVVVCPNDLHPGATAAVRSLYERIGCRVTEQPAAEHDRLMAHTHALAFFVAKGMIDIGVVDQIEFSPPSFRAMAQTIESTRTDAGHLFQAIQRDNPFASEARQRLLDALASVHARLERGAPLDPDHAPLDIPDLGDAAPELRETRDLIDDIDHELVRLLARRATLARRAGEIKAERGRGVRDRAREQALLEDRERWAQDLALDAPHVSRIFDAILAFSRDVQQRRGSPPDHPSDPEQPS